MTVSPASTATLDTAEVDRFRQLADDWWDPRGRMRPLHEIAPARLSFIRDTACRHFGRDQKSMRPLEGLDVLDIGCAAGLVSEPIARMGARVTGIDPGAELIAAARHARGRLRARRSITARTAPRTWWRPALASISCSASR